MTCNNYNFLVAGSLDRPKAYRVFLGVDEDSPDKETGLAPTAPLSTSRLNLAEEVAVAADQDAYNSDQTDTMSETVGKTPKPSKKRSKAKKKAESEAAVYLDVSLQKAQEETMSKNSDQIEAMNETAEPTTPKPVKKKKAKKKATKVEGIEGAANVDSSQQTTVPVLVSGGLQVNHV